MDKEEKKKLKEEKKKLKKEKKVKLTKEEKLEQNGNFRERLSLKIRRNLIGNKTRTWLLVLALVLIFLVINLWAQDHATIQIDVTEGKIYTLSQTSKDQLADLDKEVMIYIYGYEESDEYVTFIKQYTEFNSNIKYEIVTTENNYEIIQEYELDEYDYGTFIIKCGDKDMTVYPDYSFYSYDYSTGGYVYSEEEVVTNAILNVSTDDPVKIYFVTGHGEISTSDISYLVSALEDKVYETEELNLFTATEIPEDCDVLAILSPEEDFTEDEANVVINYIENGGNLFITLYKSSESSDYTNFQTILDEYGAGVQYGLLYEGSVSNYYYYNYYLVPELSYSSDITSDLAEGGYTALFPYSQQVTESDVEDENVEIDTEAFIYSSSSCYNITSEEDIVQGIDLSESETDSWTIGEKFTRTVTNEDGETESTSSLILIANYDFILDSFFSYIGSNSVYVANETIALNSFADLAEQDNLISIQKYSSSSTSFTKTATTLNSIVVQVIVFAIPILIIIAGIIIWINRRRKR